MLRINLKRRSKTKKNKDIQLIRNLNENILNMKLRNIPFSPPDMTEAEVAEVREAILSGWIITTLQEKNLSTITYL